MSRKKISTTIYVTAEQSERLKLLSERTRVPVAEYIREGINMVLRHYQHLLPGQLPLVDEPKRTKEVAPENDDASRESLTTRVRSDRSSPSLLEATAQKK